MKKSTEKSLKLQIKSVFEFSAADTGINNFSDPPTVTVLTITTVAGPKQL
jgi:hypothetical protein